MTDRAVVLVSGGLDSATCLAIACDQGYACFALSFEYGQRSVSEFAVAKRVVETQGVIEQRIVSPGLDELGGSALTGKNLMVPECGTEGIPVAFITARNTVFLSYALGLGLSHLHIGIICPDYLGYPDCRPATSMRSRV